MKNIFTTVVFFTLSLSSPGQTVTDIDGNLYNTVIIGTQTWMKENLRVTKLNDGSDIPLVTDGNNWVQLSTPAMCTYNNTTDTGFINPYGRLYNWFVVKKICPQGWHVPTNDECNVLVNYLGGIYSAYHKMREAGTLHWTSASDSVDNSSGFTALPGGYRHAWFGSYVFLSSATAWWSSSDYSTVAGFMDISSELMLASINKDGIFQYGFSIRCLEDNIAGINNENKMVTPSVFPNPAKNVLYIKNAGTPRALVEIVNLQGELMLQENNVSSSIDIGNLENGIYIVRIISPKTTIALKFAKE